MRFGLYGINHGPLSDRDAAVEVAQACERAGFDSLWTAEHVVLPDPHQAPSPLPPKHPILDPVVSLSLLAGKTTSIALATGIIILPQRNPVVLAKELASLDVISGGRLWFGFAAGYLHQEFAAVGASFADRGRRCDEYLEAMVELWSSDQPQYEGEHVRFSDIDARPRPLQSPTPKLVVGGSSGPAFRRALRYGHGLFGFAWDLDTTRSHLAALEAMRAHVERPAALGDLELTVTPPPGPLGPETVSAYAELGVQRLVVLPLARTTEEVLEVVHATEPLVAG